MHKIVRPRIFPRIMLAVAGQFLRPYSIWHCHDLDICMCEVLALVTKIEPTHEVQPRGGLVSDINIMLLVPTHTLS